jgi:membrane protease YdiL (CAAX protease family)
LGKLVGAGLLVAWVVLAAILVVRLGPPRSNWRIREAVRGLVAFFAGSALGGTGIILLSGRDLEGEVQLMPAVVGSLLGAITGIVATFRMASHRELGFVPPPAWAWSAALVIPPLFIAVSTAWTWMIQDLTPDPAAQGVVAMIQAASPGEKALGLAYGVIAAPFVEELLFRGLVLSALNKEWGPWPALLVQGTLFGLVHIADPYTVLPLSIFGIGLGWLRLRSASLYPVLLAHMVNNLVAFTMALL